MGYRTNQRIHSKIDDVAALVFHRFPTKPAPIDRVVRIDGCVVGLGRDEFGRTRIYSSEVQGDTYGWMPTNRAARTMKCLHRLGVLSEEVWNKHVAAEEAERKARDDRWRARHMIEYAGELGVKLTPTQVARLQALAGPANVEG